MSAIYRNLQRKFRRCRLRSSSRSRKADNETLNEATQEHLAPGPTTPAPAPQSTPQTASVPSPLEQLPFEIQRLILPQAPTFGALRALVHASPQLHSVYVQDRLPILRDFVEQSFGGFLVDAHAAYISGDSEFQLSRSEPMLWEYVDAYRHRLTALAPGELVAQLSLQQLLQMIRFHCSVIEPLTERYATWALAALSSSPKQYPLSGTERRRIQRALYRLQVFCNVCGSGGEGRSATPHIGEPLDRLRVLGLFPAWQIEEVLCIHEFAKDVYGGVFDRVAWDLDEERNPKYQHIAMQEVEWGLILFSRPHYYINERSRDDMLRQGLTLLDAVLRTTGQGELVQLVRQSILSMWGGHGGTWDDWLDDAIDGRWEEERRDNWYSEEDAAQDRRDKIPFVTDTPYMPPLAWVMNWYGEASNLFGWCIPGTFRRWGYTMWDAKRLEATGVLKFIELERWWTDARERFSPPVTDDES